MRSFLENLNVICYGYHKVIVRYKYILYPMYKVILWFVCLYYKYDKMNFLLTTFISKPVNFRAKNISSIFIHCLFVVSVGICMESTEQGPCRGMYQRWAFMAQKGMCVPFQYGGCRGNKNNFITQEDCMNTCSVVLGKFIITTLHSGVISSYILSLAKKWIKMKTIRILHLSKCQTIHMASRILQKIQNVTPSSNPNRSTTNYKEL